MKRILSLGLAAVILFTSINITTFAVTETGMTEEVAATEAPSSNKEAAPSEAPSPSEEAASSETPSPSEESSPTETPSPSEEAVPTETPSPLEPSESPAVPSLSETPLSSSFASPSEMPSILSSATPSGVPLPSSSATPCGTPSASPEELDYILGRPMTEEEISRQEALVPEYLPLLPEEDTVESYEEGIDTYIVLEERYDSREHGLVTSVKNQNPYGTCWTYGTLASLESSLIVAGEADSDLDLSEWHLAYYAFHTGTDALGNTLEDYVKEPEDANAYMRNGGNISMAVTALSNWKGAAKEEDYPGYPSFSQLTEAAAALTYNDAWAGDAYYMNNCYITPMTDMTSVKQLIAQYGTVYATYYHQNSYMNWDTAAYYYNGAPQSNHAIALVGWDDKYSRENFAAQEDAEREPEGDGAWIVKNSWGSASADNGYFYISYYDTSLNNYNAAAVLGKRAEGELNNYYYSGGVNIGSSLSVTGVAQCYTAHANQGGAEKIEGVGFYTRNSGVSYSVQVYKNPECNAEGEVINPESGQAMLVYPETGMTGYAGYHTIEFSQTVTVAEGDIFSVAISFDEAAVYVDYTRTYTQGGTVIYDSVNITSEGESFVRTAGSGKFTDTSLNKTNGYTPRMNVITRNVEGISDSFLVYRGDAAEREQLGSFQTWQEAAGCILSDGASDCDYEIVVTKDAAAEDGFVWPQGIERLTISGQLSGSGENSPILRVGSEITAGSSLTFRDITLMPEDDLTIHTGVYDVRFENVQIKGKPVGRIAGDSFMAGSFYTDSNLEAGSVENLSALTLSDGCIFDALSVETGSLYLEADEESGKEADCRIVGNAEIHNIINRNDGNSLTVSAVMNSKTGVWNCGLSILGNVEENPVLIRLMEHLPEETHEAERFADGNYYRPVAFFAEDRNEQGQYYFRNIRGSVYMQFYLAKIRETDTGMIKAHPDNCMPFGGKPEDYAETDYVNEDGNIVYRNQVETVVLSYYHNGQKVITGYASWQEAVERINKLGQKREYTIALMEDILSVNGNSLKPGSFTMPKAGCAERLIIEGNGKKFCFTGNAVTAGADITLRNITLVPVKANTDAATKEVEPFVPVLDNRASGFQYPAAVSFKVNGHELVLGEEVTVEAPLLLTGQKGSLEIAGTLITAGYSEGSKAGSYVCGGREGLSEGLAGSISGFCDVSIKEALIVRNYYTSAAKQAGGTLTAENIAQMADVQVQGKLTASAKTGLYGSAGNKVHLKAEKIAVNDLVLYHGGMEADGEFTVKGVTVSETEDNELITRQKADAKGQVMGVYLAINGKVLLSEEVNRIEIGVRKRDTAVEENAVLSGAPSASGMLLNARTAEGLCFKVSAANCVEETPRLVKKGTGIYVYYASAAPVEAAVMENGKETFLGFYASFSDASTAVDARKDKAGIYIFKFHDSPGGEKPEKIKFPSYAAELIVKKAEGAAEDVRIAVSGDVVLKYKLTIGTDTCLEADGKINIKELSLGENAKLVIGRKGDLINDITSYIPSDTATSGRESAVYIKFGADLTVKGKVSNETGGALLIEKEGAETAYGEADITAGNRILIAPKAAASRFRVAVSGIPAEGITFKHGGGVYLASENAESSGMLPVSLTYSSKEGFSEESCFLSWTEAITDINSMNEKTADYHISLLADTENTGKTLNMPRAGCFGSLSVNGNGYSLIWRGSMAVNGSCTFKNVVFETDAGDIILKAASGSNARLVMDACGERAADINDGGFPEKPVFRNIKGDGKNSGLYLINGTALSVQGNVTGLTGLYLGINEDGAAAGNAVLGISGKLGVGILGLNGRKDNLLNDTRLLAAGNVSVNGLTGQNGTLIIKQSPKGNEYTNTVINGISDMPDGSVLTVLMMCPEIAGLTEYLNSLKTGGNPFVEDPAGASLLKAPLISAKDVRTARAEFSGGALQVKPLEDAVYYKNANQHIKAGYGGEMRIKLSAGNKNGMKDFGYAVSWHEAVRILGGMGNQYEKYCLELSGDTPVLTGWDARKGEAVAGGLFLPSGVKGEVEVKCAQNSGASLIYTGGMKIPGGMTLTMNGISFEQLDRQGNAVKKKIAVGKGGMLRLIDETESCREVEGITAPNGSLYLERTQVMAEGNLEIKNLYASGREGNALKGSRKMKIHFIHSGEEGIPGKVRLTTVSTYKSVKSGSQLTALSQLTVSGDIAEDMSVELYVSKGIGAAGTDEAGEYMPEELLVAPGETVSPAKMLASVAGNAADGRMVLTDKDGNRLTGQGGYSLFTEAGGLYLAEEVPSVKVYCYEQNMSRKYNGNFRTLDAALKAIAVSARENASRSYEVVLEEQPEEALAFNMPAKVKQLDFDCMASGNERMELKVRGALKLKSNTAFHNIVLTGTDSIQTGKYELSLENAEVETSGNISAKDIWMVNAELTGKNITVTGRADMKGSCLKAAMDNEASSGKLRLAALNNLNEKQDEANILAAKQDAKGKSGIKISGKVLNTGGVNAPFKVELYYNRAGSLQIRPRNGEALLNAVRADADLFTVQSNAEDYGTFKRGSDIYWGSCTGMEALLINHEEGAGNTLLPDMKEAVAEINRRKDKKASYTIELPGDGEIRNSKGTLASLAMPAYGEKVTIKGTGQEPAEIKFSGNITLKCNTVFDNVNLISFKTTGRKETVSPGVLSGGKYLIQFAGKTAFSGRIQGDAVALANRAALTCAEIKTVSLSSEGRADIHLEKGKVITITGLLRQSGMKGNITIHMDYGTVPNGTKVIAIKSLRGKADLSGLRIKDTEGKGDYVLYQDGRAVYCIGK